MYLCNILPSISYISLFRLCTFGGGEYMIGGGAVEMAPLPVTDAKLLWSGISLCICLVFLVIHYLFSIDSINF